MREFVSQSNALKLGSHTYTLIDEIGNYSLSLKISSLLKMFKDVHYELL